MSGLIGVLSRELLILKTKFWKVCLSSAVSPFLFLLAFGFGVGQNVKIDNVNYLTFLIPGLITMSSMNQSYSISTEINISRFYFKIFDEFLLAPISRWEIIVGEVLYGMIKGMIPVFIILVYSYFLKIRIHYFSLAFLVSLIIHLIIFSLLGFVVALIVKNHADQFSINTFVITPMVFLSGTFYPVDKMPFLVQIITKILPLTYTVSLLRESLLNKCFSTINLCISIFIVFVLIIFAMRVLSKIETV